MFSGFMAIIHASRMEFIHACWFIVLAAGFDSLDGFMARLTKSTSQFGVEIDSLSDVVSFGAAPAFLVYKLGLGELGGIGILISSLLMIFGGLRLARFNVQLVGFDKDYFTGLPIPASAITVASFVVKYSREDGGIDPVAMQFLPWMCVALGLLMVSKVKYDTLPKPSRRNIRKEPWKFVVIAAAAIGAVVTKGDLIFPFFVLFILFGIARYLKNSIQRLGHHSRAKFDDEVVEPTRAEP
jgi:CDP-diacylglycerol--serine O-phosphatidyltransferase